MRDIKQWFADDGDNTLLLDHDLNEDSVIYDLGGYLGLWNGKMYDKYKCRIEVFDPIFVGTAVKSDKVTVHEFGLFDRDMIAVANVMGDATTLFGASTPTTARG